MDVYLIVTLIAFLVYVQVSTYVIIALPTSRVKGLLLIISLLFAFFSLSVFFLAQFDDVTKTVFFSRLAISSMLILPALFNYLFYVINDRAKPVVGRIGLFFFLPFLILLIIGYNWSPVKMGVLSQVDNGYAFFFYPVNFWKRIVLMYFVLSMAFAIWQLMQWRKYAVLNRTKHQAIIILLSVCLFALSVLVLDVFIPGLGYKSFPFLIHVLGVPIIAAISYSLIGLSVESYSTEVIGNLISGRISAYVLFFDRRGKVVAANHFARKSLGYGKFEIQELIANQLCDSQNDVDFLTDASRYYEIRDHLLEIKHKEGVRIPVLVAVIRMPDKLWGHGGFILIAHDHKHIVRLEHAIQKSRDRMQQALSRNTELKRVLGERSGDISNIKAKLEKQNKSIYDSDGFFGLAKRERETLTGEMYHRVKNNIQIVISLIHFMRNDPALTPSEQEGFMSIVERIRKISSIHDVFYATPFLAKIDFGSYVRKTSEAFHNTYGLKAAMVYRVNTDDIHLNIRHILPCSIILDELLKNVYTHAFPDDYIRELGRDVTAVISVFCKYNGDSIVFGVRDNGIGYESSIDRHEGNGIGLLVARHLAERLLDASFAIKTSFGTCVEISFQAGDD